MLDFCTAAPIPISINGRSFKVGALTLREEGELVAYLRASVPRPTAELRAVLDLYPEDERRRASIAAIQADRDWPPAPGSPDGQKLFLGTPEGQKFFLGVVLRKYQPELTDADIDRLMGEIHDEDYLVLFHIAFGADVSDPESLRATIRRNLRALRDALAGIVAPDGADSPTGSSSSTT